MRAARIILAIAGIVIALWATFHPGEASAQSETDRLREALRSATAQTRALEDQRTALQGQLAEMTRARDALKADVAAAKAQARKSEMDYRTAVREFNDRLEERNQTLEKWKDAYTEAADVARTKDAERAKFEAQSKAYRESTKACIQRNQELVKVGRELMGRYESVTFGDVVVANEPLLGFRRVEIQNLLQDYGDRILNQKIEP
jgi:DNA repair exonuclease SbcCD ATPase subunit